MSESISTPIVIEVDDQHHPRRNETLKDDIAERLEKSQAALTRLYKELEALCEVHRNRSPKISDITVKPEWSGPDNDVLHMRAYANVTLQVQGLNQ